MNPWNLLFPFQKYMKNFSTGPGTKDMESFMNNMFETISKSNFNPKDKDESSANREKKLKKHYSDSGPELFETHSDVYVRIPIKNTAILKHMKVYHTSNTSIIEGYPKPEDRHVFTLPAIVKKKGGSAQYRDGMLEIKLAKAADLQYSEIHVTELS